MCTICEKSHGIDLCGDATELPGVPFTAQLTDYSIEIELGDSMLIIPVDYCPSCGKKLLED